MTGFDLQRNESFSGNRIFVCVDFESEVEKERLVGLKVHCNLG